MLPPAAAVLDSEAHRAMAGPPGPDSWHDPPLLRDRHPMAGDTPPRATSEGGASSASSHARVWSLSLSSVFKRLPKASADKSGARRPSHADSDTPDPSLHLPNADSHSLNETQECNCRQLQALVHRMRSAPSGPSHVDAAYEKFVKHKDTCSALCYAILRDDIRPGPVRAPSNPTAALRYPNSSIGPPASPGPDLDHRSSYSARSLADVGTASAPKPALANELCLNVIRDWKNWLETLVEAFRISLANTYKSYERDATPDMIDLLFSSKKFRKEAVNRMRNASVTRVLSADPQFFPRYEIRFRNYEKIKRELIEIQHLLHSAESGISPSRPVHAFAISPQGDAILEFANLTAEYSSRVPALQFRVSSKALAETSPIFAHMFSGNSTSLHLHEAGDQLPPPPTQYTCKDGSEVKLYRMPQHEVNRLMSMEILLHAAHTHGEMVPRQVSFEQFVAIAECSIRYKSTSPLESVVERRWLPQWMRKGADDMPDGLLVISYAFGLRQLFSRMSKSAILDIVDDRDLQSKPWPPKIKDKIWAVRCAKVAQVYACCTGTIQEYIRPRARGADPEAESVSPSELHSNLSTPAAKPTSSPRCPKGSHSCDAANLGWIILMYNEMNVLPHIVRPEVMLHLPEAEPRPRSLAQMVDVLRRMPSPASPIHRGGVCDPSPSFRTAIADIYNSVTGLTLHDISGKSHGWALSKHQMTEPQTLLTAGQERMTPYDQGHYTVASEFPDNIRLQILGELDDVHDLHAAARTSRGFYRTFKRHEPSLIGNFLHLGRVGSGSLKAPAGINHTELKMRKEEWDMMQQGGLGVCADAVTLRSDDSDGDFSDSDSDDLTSVGGVLTPPRYVDDGRRLGGAAASPATPRQPPIDMRGPPTAPTANQPEMGTAAVHEDPVTDERAWRILWPDSVESGPPGSVAVAPAGAEVLRQKFRIGDGAFAEKLEEKTLVVMGEKQLRSEHDRRRVGLLNKDDGRPATSRCKPDGNAGSEGV